MQVRGHTVEEQEGAPPARPDRHRFPSAKLRQGCRESFLRTVTAQTLRISALMTSALEALTPILRFSPYGTALLHRRDGRLLGIMPVVEVRISPLADG